jgi:hypothetical protein
MSHPNPSNSDAELLSELRHYKRLAAKLPHDEVKMELPEGASLKTERGAWKIKWHSSRCIIGPSNEKSFKATLKMYNEPDGQYSHLVSKSVTPVAFGAVTGFKRVLLVPPDINPKDVEYTMLVPGSKDVDYTLQVPGGFASAGILKRGMKWDESEWEQFFHTIQMIKHEKAG